MNWRERLRTVVESSGRRQAAIAADAGIAPETLSRILNSPHARPEFETIVRIAHAADENVGWLLDEHGFALSAEELAQVRKAMEIVERTLLKTASPKRDAGALPNAEPVSKQPRGAPWPNARIVFRAVGETMTESGIANGDLLFVRPTKNVRDAAGKIVVCRLAGAAYVKQLELEAGRIRLVSRNPRFAPIEVDEDAGDFQLIGIVVGRSGPPSI
ncbi:MAG TPA: S24 family peptidase [Thermoanaerobaculia bacterium]|nr:S24 family peptidase [Thermoanaerobaculia bacterium]